MMTMINAPARVTPRLAKPTGARGFTLVELMIVVVVVGILAAIAYPSYQSSIRKSRRADAHAAISALQQAEERLRGSCRFYGRTIAAADVCGADPASTTVRGSASSPEGFYNLTIESATGTGYVIEADPQGPQATDSDCDPISLTVSADFPNGQRGPADCW